tara:strand:- start:254 stop:1093 length:840 start_codon:yes stop_codon:yes gene_type:complete
MANTIDWGEASVNNTNGYGKGATNNTIRWGKIYESSSSGETNITGASGFSNTLSTRFDGVDDYVTMGNVASLRFDYNDAFSFSFWLNRTTSSDTTCILSRADKDSPFSGYIVLVQDNKIYFRLRNDSSNNFFMQGTVNIPNETWTHYVVTYDGSNSVSGMTLYKNGLSETVTTTSSGTVSSYASLSVPFNLATRDNLPNIAYNGAMDEVSAYNVELSASAVTTIYNSGAPNDLTGTSGLVSWWRMGDNDTYPTISDNQGSNNGTMTNMSSGNFITNVPT